MIIDCHGHYTTAPKALETWRNQQIAGIKDPAAMPRAADLKISDDELRETIETKKDDIALLKAEIKVATRKIERILKSHSELAAEFSPPAEEEDETPKKTKK